MDEKRTFAVQHTNVRFQAGSRLAVIQAYDEKRTPIAREIDDPKIALLSNRNSAISKSQFVEEMSRDSMVDKTAQKRRWKHDGITDRRNRSLVKESGTVAAGCPAPARSEQ